MRLGVHRRRLTTLCAAFVAMAAALLVPVPSVTALTPTPVMSRPHAVFAEASARKHGIALKVSTAGIDPTGLVTITGSARISGGAAIYVDFSELAADGSEDVIAGAAVNRASGAWSLVFQGSPTLRKSLAGRVTAMPASPGGSMVHKNVSLIAAPEPVKAEPDVVKAAGDPAAFDFITREASGSPARWDTCRPAWYRINPAGAPPGSEAVIHEAFARAAAASGIPFAYACESDVVPFSPGVQYPLGQADTVYVAFSSADVVADLRGGVIALGGSGYTSTPAGRTRLALGAVVVDTDATSLEVGFHGGYSLGSLVIHELGHVMNLAHVNAPDQVMDPYLKVSSPTDYQAGDRAGLALLTAEGCLD